MQDKIIRNIQVDLILSNPNPIIEWFNGIWKDLSVIEVNVCHQKGGELIYYNTDNKWIFFRDDKNDKFWCHYIRFWLLFQTKFNLKSNQIQDLTKILVEDNNVATPLPLDNEFNCIIEDALNKETTT